MKVKIGSNKMKVNMDIAKIYPELENIEITPSTQAQEFSGQYGNIQVKAVDNTIDNNISSNNIKSGIEILGVSGNIEIPSGTIEIYESGTHDVKNYEYANVNINVYPPNWQQIGYSNTPQFIIDGFNYAKQISENWDNSITDMSNKYKRDKNLLCFPLVDTSNVTNMYAAFYESNINEMPLIDTHNTTNFNDMFYGCKNLRYVPQFNTQKLRQMSTTFSSCSYLTNESLNNILGMCANAVNITMVKRLISIGLTQEQAAICITLPNWTAAQQAGWITGYNIE